MQRLRLRRSSGLVSFRAVSLAPEQIHRAHTPAAYQMRQADARVRDLPTTRLAAQLQHQLVDLGQAGRAAGMTARDEPTVRVERDASAQLGLPVF